jgi:glycine C-acetyltransferase
MKEFSRLHQWIRNSDEARLDDMRTDSLPSPHFRWRDRNLISFSSNNYLSLASHPRMVEAAKRGLEEFGVGNCESRLLGGDLEVYRRLEQKIAALKHKEACVLFATGYLTNLGALTALVRALQVFRPYGYRAVGGQKTTYFSDEFNHLSIREGIRASGADRFTYRHLDLAHLETCLKKSSASSASSASTKIIVTDGVFSQDGDIAPLPDLLELADRYDGFVYVDDAHGTGVLGANGGGISEHFQTYHPRLIHMGTLSKAYGAIGGFIAADTATVEVIRLAASAYGFTSTLPPDQAFAVLEAIKIIQEEPDRRLRLWDNQRYFCDQIRAIGYQLISRETPIVPVLIGNAALCTQFSHLLREKGFHVDPVKFPAVAHGRARLRFIVNADHTRADIDALMYEMLELKKFLKMPDSIPGFAPLAESRLLHEA